MSTHDPTRRPWGTAKGARIIALSAWVLVAVSAALAAAWWVGMLHGDAALQAPSLVAFNVSIFVGIGALGIGLWTAHRRGEEESATLPRLPGSWFTGAGLGTITAVALAPTHDLVALAWGLLMLACGVMLFASPVLLAQYRARKVSRHSHTRATGVRAHATVTDVHTFYRQHLAHHRMTMRFSDRQGTQRWFTQTAPGGGPWMTEGQTLALHYDPSNPARKKTLVVDWPTW